MIAGGQGTGTITNDDTAVVRQRPWQNQRDRHDVNDVDGVTALDVLMLINYINDASRRGRVAGVPRDESTLL